MSKAKWASYSPAFQLQAARVFISYNPEACEGALPAKVVAFMDTWVASGDPPVGEANLAMFNYCYEVLGGKKNLPKDFDY